MKIKKIIFSLKQFLQEAQAKKVIRNDTIFIHLQYFSEKGIPPKVNGINELK